MSGTGRHQSGLAAEEIAERAYMARGASVIASRCRTEAGEIDLILREGPVVVFVEVKARRHQGPDSPVARRQWARIAAAAEIWMAAHPDPTVTGWRFDAVVVDATGAAVIYEDAHRPGL